MLKSYNPADGSLLGEVKENNQQEIAEIVTKSREAQKIWGALDIDERIRYLVKAGEALSKKVADIGMLLSLEMGKSLSRGTGEVSGCAGSIEYVAAEVKSAIEPIIMRGYGGEIVTEYKPHGVCGIISPWNYPVSMAHWMIIPALTCGNTVVLKPSEETPLVAKAYVEAMSSQLPEGVLQIIFGGEEAGKALVCADVDFIGFTGSLEAGKDIMKSASQKLTPLMMELGGKDPLIVLEDADLDRAASFAVGNSLENSGQMCISTERIFVEESVADKFIEKVVKYTSMYKVGPCTDRQADIGPIINERQRNRILTHIDEACSKGAEIIYGGINHPERFINPTVVLGVTDEMLIAKEETFGPVICITKFTDLDEAIKSANMTEYGLGGVVFGKERAEYVASRIESGMVGINTGSQGGGQLPWVGAKQSSFGYHGSPDGHRQFTRPKVISRNL